MIRRLALSKGKIYAALGAFVVIGALAAALAIQAARLDLAQLERDTATAMYEHTTAQLQAAQAHSRRTEEALHRRSEKLLAINRQSQALRSQLQRLSQEVDNEKWQACRTVRTPDALLYGVRAPGDEN